MLGGYRHLLYKLKLLAAGTTLFVQVIRATTVEKWNSMVKVVGKEHGRCKLHLRWQPRNIRWRSLAQYSNNSDLDDNEDERFDANSISSNDIEKYNAQASFIDRSSNSGGGFEYALFRSTTKKPGKRKRTTLMLV
jgi:hypothetical protein